MDPIISPWFFYWMDILPGLGGFFVGMAALSLLLFLIALGVSEGAVFESKKGKVFMCACAVMACTAWMPSLFFPSKEAIIQMAVASQTTPDNIDAIVEFGIEFKDEAKEDLIEIMDAIREEE